MRLCAYIFALLILCAPTIARAELWESQGQDQPFCANLPANGDVPTWNAAEAGYCPAGGAGGGGATVNPCTFLKCDVIFCYNANMINGSTAVVLDPTVSGDCSTGGVVAGFTSGDVGKLFTGWEPNAFSQYTFRGVDTTIASVQGPANAMLASPWTGPSGNDQLIGYGTGNAAKANAYIAALPVNSSQTWDWPFASAAMFEAPIISLARNISMIGQGMAGTNSDAGAPYGATVLIPVWAALPANPPYSELYEEDTQGIEIGDLQIMGDDTYGRVMNGIELQRASGGTIPGNVQTQTLARFHDLTIGSLLNNGLPSASRAPNLLHGILIDGVGTQNDRGILDKVDIERVGDDVGFCGDLAGNSAGCQAVEWQVRRLTCGFSGVCWDQSHGGNVESASSGMEDLGGSLSFWLGGQGFTQAEGYDNEVDRAPMMAPPWVASRNYPLGFCIETAPYSPSTAGSPSTIGTTGKFEVVTAGGDALGTSGATEPSWATPTNTTGTTWSDNTLTWTTEAACPAALALFSNSGSLTIHDSQYGANGSNNSVVGGNDGNFTIIGNNLVVIPTGDYPIGIGTQRVVGAQVTGVGTSATGTLPTGAVLGDLLIAVLTQKSGSRTITPATGWTQVAQKFTTSGTNDTQITVFQYAVNVFSPIAPVFSWTGSVGYDLRIADYTGVRVSVVDNSQIGTASSNSASTVTAPALTPSQAGDLELVVVASATQSVSSVVGLPNLATAWNDSAANVSNFLGYAQQGSAATTTYIGTIASSATAATIDVLLQPNTPVINLNVNGTAPRTFICKACRGISQYGRTASNGTIGIIGITSAVTNGENQQITRVDVERLADYPNGTVGDMGEFFINALVNGAPIDAFLNTWLGKGLFWGGPLTINQLLSPNAGGLGVAVLTCSSAGSTDSYQYEMTGVSGTGETQPSAPLTQTCNSAIGVAGVSMAGTLYPLQGAASYNVYRTVAGGSTFDLDQSVPAFQFFSSASSNGFIDMVPDGSLNTGRHPPTSNSTGTLAVQGAATFGQQPVATGNPLVSGFGLQQLPAALLPTFSEKVLADTPGGFWRLAIASGNATDSSGNSNTGTAHGTITYSQAALVQDDPATSVKLDGSTGYFSVANNASLPSGDNVWAEAIVEPACATTQTFIAQTTGGYQFLVDASGQVELSQIGGANVASNTVIPCDGNPHDVAFYKNGSSIYLFLDGVSLGYINGGIGTLAPANAALTIGQVGGAEFFNGLIADVSTGTGGATTVADLEARGMYFSARKNGTLYYDTTNDCVTAVSAAVWGCL